MKKKQNCGEYKGIWVLAEQTTEGISSVTFELLSKARELKAQGGITEPVTVVMLGTKLGDYPGKLAEAGAQAVILVDHPALEYFQNDTYGAILTVLVEEKKPSILLMGATGAGSDLAPTLGAKLRTGVSAHCVDLRLNEGGHLVSVVPAFGGAVLGDILCTEFRPQMATVRPGILPKATCFVHRVDPTVEEFDPTSIIAQDKGRIKALGMIQEEVKGVPLETAPIVIAGGFGMGGKENWQLLETLANMLGGAVGCTRPPLDEGWATEYQMIGTSGKSVRPSVYIGVGISGATHHVCGMKDAGLVININKDDKAPIFDVSDIRITGDGAIILPLLIAGIQEYGEDVICANE